MKNTDTIPTPCKHILYFRASRIEEKSGFGTFLHFFVSIGYLTLRTLYALDIDTKEEEIAKRLTAITSLTIEYIEEIDEEDISSNSTETVGNSTQN